MSPTRSPLGYAVTALNTVAQSELLDRFGMRRRAEQAVYQATRSGSRTLGLAHRAFASAGRGSATGERVRPADPLGTFDLTPTEDEQALVDLVTRFGEEVLRPVAAAADDACSTPREALAGAAELGLAQLGVPESLGGIAETRSAMTGTLVAEALSHGDLGLAVAVLAPGSVATALALWGTEGQQQTYLPFLTESAPPPAAALALAEPRVLFDVLSPATTASPSGDGFVLNGEKSFVPRGADAELFVVGADLEGEAVLFLVPSGTPGVSLVADPSMGVRAAGLSRLVLDDVRVGADAVLGETDGSTYLECVRLSRLAWCALAVGTAQAVLDHVTPYVNEREAFGEPISHRQSVAFMVADLAIELEAMRLVTYRAASRAAQGLDFGREVALARELCASKGVRIGLDGVQLLGGHGFVKEHPVERWYRDLRAVGLAEGAVLV